MFGFRFCMKGLKVSAWLPLKGHSKIEALKRRKLSAAGIKAKD